MSELTVTGKIKVINQVQTFDSGFTKREFVITTNDQYPQDIVMSFFKDKTSILDKYSVGDEVTASFNILGNEYQSKYYVNLTAWRLVKESASKTPPPAPIGEKDNLPF